MKPKIIVFIAVLFFYPFSRSIAQTQIKGLVTDDSGQPVAWANVLLLRASDSTMVKGQVVREDGSFQFEQVSAGEYWLESTMLGYKKHQTARFTIMANAGIHTIPTIKLATQNELDEIQIVAKKQLFEQKTDRLVINVTQSVTSAGSTALDVLERSPGVVVNRQASSISLSGKNGVVVMINGKINYMSPEAVVQMLQGMSANNIEKIEILATPPAYLDAEGNAGYINIILKRDNTEGLNGTAALTGGYGHGKSGSANFNFNYRRKRLTMYGDYGYVHKGTDNPMQFNREIQLNNIKIETDSRSDRFPNSNNHTGRIGFDYAATARTVVAGVISLYNTNWDMFADNRTTIASNGHIDTFLYTRTNEQNIWKHFGGSMSVQHTLRKEDQLSFEIDYLHYADNNPVNYKISRADAANMPISEETARSSKETPIGIAVAKSDYTHKISETIKMEAGIKGVLSSFSNNVRVEMYNGQQWNSDENLTGNYNLTEQIAAAYTSFEVKFNQKISGKAGLRYEYTHSNLGSEEVANLIDRRYGRFFPSLFISNQISEKQSLAFSYSRRITRPKFNELAPFVLFVDPNTFFSGNSALQPAISNTLKLDYRQSKVLFSLLYSYEDSTIARFQPRIEPGSNKQYSASTNLKYQETISLTVGAPWSPFKWWNIYVNAGAVWTNVGIWNNGTLSVVKVPAATAFSSQSFTLPKKFMFEISGFFNSGGVFGASKNRPFGTLNAGLQKKFNNDGGTLNLGYDNILNTMVFRSSFELPDQGQYFTSRLQWDFPTIKLTYTRSFGNTALKSGGKRRINAQEERERLD